MVRVVIPSGLANQFTGGVSEIDVSGARVRDLIKNLEARYPGIGKVLTEEMAVAIDGEIFQNTDARRSHRRKRNILSAADRRRSYIENQRCVVARSQMPVVNFIA